MAPSEPTQTLPVIHVVVQAGPTGRPFFFAMWRHERPDGTKSLKKRKIGPAWVTRESDGEWGKRRGRVAADHFDERTATVAASALVAQVESELATEERRQSGEGGEDASFREIAQAFLEHREYVKGTRPSTLADYRSMLAEPGVPLKRRYVRGADGKVARDQDGEPVHAVTEGWIMRRIGDKPAASVTTRQIEQILKDLADAGRGPTTVNKYRALLSSIYNYARRKSTFALEVNPVGAAASRRSPTWSSTRWKRSRRSRERWPTASTAATSART